jgi:hypothetical protein
MVGSCTVSVKCNAKIFRLIYFDIEQRLASFGREDILLNQGQGNQRSASGASGAVV